MDLFGTFAPFSRASDSPMAMACFRLLTVPPLPFFPERSVPRFMRRMALATDFPALFPYLRVPVLVREAELLLAGIEFLRLLESRRKSRVARLPCRYAATHSQTGPA